MQDGIFFYLAATARQHHIMYMYSGLSVCTESIRISKSLSFTERGGLLFLRILYAGGEEKKYKVDIQIPKGHLFKKIAH